jgi:long-chain acyl-CoA synthetase
MKTLPEMFFDIVAKFGSRVALRYYEGGESKEWHVITYQELSEKVIKMASGLRALGLERGDRISILSENCPEWAITDLAAQTLGAITVPIYPTLPSQQAIYILQNSGAKIIYVQDKKQFDKIAPHRADLPELKHVLLLETEKVAEGSGEFTPFADVAATPAQDLTAHWKQIQPEDVASLVYTSGTTGDPKGAMLMHRNFVSNALAAQAHCVQYGTPLSEKDVWLSFLPLSHIYERLGGYYLPLSVGAEIAYSRGARHLMEDFTTIQPTLMVCVPRMYEMIQERILDGVTKLPENKQKITNAALALGREAVEKRIAGKSLGFLTEIKWALYDQLVFKNLRTRFGGRLRFVITGGAALPPETGKFFLSFDINICEGYGMTESSPLITVNLPKMMRFGTVGKPAPGVEVKIAPDGEICCRGDLVMKGYWNNPEATKAMIDEENWLHTGDIGVLDADGYLKITDRKKDIIVLANGKNVAPQPIEGVLKRSPFINEIVLIGEKQSIITALVIPNMDKLSDWASSEGLEINTKDKEVLIAHPKIKDKIKAEIAANSTALADFEKIKKFTLLNATFSIESGELTPTLKIKRKIIMQKYEKEIAEMRGDE